MTYLLKLALACACALTLCAQTKDYGRDFRGVLDANQSTRSRPFRIVTSSPSGSCTVNEWAWSTAGPGNLYYCPSGTWAVFPFITLTGIETLTNKTLTAPVITSPTGLVKGDVGLGNVDNTSDATKNAASVTLTNKTLTLPILGAYTVSGLPAAATANRLAIITDALTPGSLTGGGSARTLVRDTGSAWEAIGDGGSGGGGASAVADLTDFGATKTSSTVVTLNTAASSSKPVTDTCGTTPFGFTSTATLTISGTSSTGSVKVGVSCEDATLGQIVVIHNLSATVTCSGCTTITGTASWPARVNRKWALTMTSNVWDTITGAMDLRSAHNGPIAVECSSGCTTSETGSKVSITVPPGSFDPIDWTFIWQRYIFSASTTGYETAGTGMGFSAGCGGDTPVSGTASDPEGMPLSSSTAVPCFWFSKIKMGNFAGGASPKAYTYIWRGGRYSAGSNDIYWGFSGADSNVDDFIGIRYLHASALYQCIKRAGGSDLGVVTITGASADTSAHDYKVVGSAVQNVFTCQIDSGTPVNAPAGTIPSPATWRATSGTLLNSTKVNHVFMAWKVSR